MPELMAVQEEALRQSRGRPGFGFFLEQGLGKTGTGLTEFHQYKQSDLVDGMGIVCPNSLKQNWADEARDVWGLPYKVGIWPKNDPRKEDLDIFIMNYEALISSGYAAMEYFIQTRRVYFGADESTRIKTHSSQSTKKALLLARYAPFRRIFTGTPMTETVMDLWPQLRFIGELSGVNPYAFRNHYGIMGGYMGKQVVGHRNDEQLQDLLRSCGFRALKKDWLKDLPEKMPTVIHDVGMTPEQKIVYDEMKEDFFTLVNRNEISASQVINQMEKLAQIGRGFIYDDQRRAVELVSPANNPAVKETINILSQTTGKTIIVTVHKYCTKMLKELIPGAAVMASEVDMKSWGLTLDGEKHRFNHDDSCRNVIMQESVGAFGHTMLGSGTGVNRCATTIFFENAYSLLQRLQMEDRNHRKGQDKGIDYHDISANPIDRRVVKALDKKLDVVKAIVDAVRKAV